MSGRRPGLIAAGLPPEVRLEKRGLLALVDEVCARRFVERSAVIGKTRGGSVDAARREVYRRLRELGLSYPEIGALFDRDHTTVMSCCKTRVRVAS